MHFGVDVSSNNPHPLDYAAVVAYLRQLGGGAQPFVVVKVCQGTGYVNPYAQGDVAGFRAAGAAVAGYLMDEGAADVSAEEATYRQVAGVLPQTDDDELPDGLSPAAYADHCRRLVAENPAAADYLNQSEVAGGFPVGGGLWLAQYNGDPGVTAYPCLIHQYSDAGQIPGVAGDFDLNAWTGSEAQFSAFFSGAPSFVPVPTIAGRILDLFTLSSDTNPAIYGCDGRVKWLLSGPQAAVCRAAGVPNVRLAHDGDDGYPLVPETASA